MFLPLMKEDKAVNAFAIEIFKMALRNPNFGGRKWHPLFYTKGMLKNNLYQKNQL